MSEKLGAAAASTAAPRSGSKPASTVAAIDLGATSGRVILGRLEGRSGEAVLRTEQVARFANDPVRTRDGLHWNLLSLYSEALAGLAAAERQAPGAIASVGIDSWAVDYGLMREGRLLGVPYHYRDERCEAGVATVHARVPAAELYARNGLQHLNFNTVFQFATEGPLLEIADRALLVPDLLNYWLTGAEFAEHTNASTTGLYDPTARVWDLELATQLGVPAGILPPLVEPGTPLGVLSPEVAAAVGRPLQVTSVASHDTASAVAAIPAERPDFAYISCGTWGLVGLELDAPVLTEAARAANFTNEGGIGGTTRFLHNVMGMWLLSESLRHWHPGASGRDRARLLSELLSDAAKVSFSGPVFDVNDPSFMPPGDIPGRITNWYAARGERAPASPAEMVRCIVESLAQAFADAVFTAAELADRSVSVIHIVGGGSLNTLLCQALADRAGLPVLAGPVEATAMGNLLVQAQALEQLPEGLPALRAVVARSSQLVTYTPRG